MTFDLRTVSSLGYLLATDDENPAPPVIPGTSHLELDHALPFPSVRRKKPLLSPSITLFCTVRPLLENSFDSH